MLQEIHVSNYYYQVNVSGLHWRLYQPTQRRSACPIARATTAATGSRSCRLPMPANFSPIVRRSIRAVQLASVEKKRVKDLKAIKVDIFVSFIFAKYCRFVGKFNQSTNSKGHNKNCLFYGGRALIPYSNLRLSIVQC